MLVIHAIGFDTTSVNIFARAAGRASVSAMFGQERGAEVDGKTEEPDAF